MRKITHAEYCRNKLARMNGSYFFAPDGVSLWCVDGEYLSQKEMDDRYPVKGVQLVSWKELKHNKGENPNQSKNFS